MKTPIELFKTPFNPQQLRELGRRLKPKWIDCFSYAKQEFGYVFTSPEFHRITPFTFHILRIWKGVKLPNLPIVFKSATLAVSICLLTGCSSITGERIAQDGSKLTIRAHRMLWKSEKISFSLESQGLKATLSVGSSATDAETAGAITEGAVKALTRP